MVAMGGVGLPPLFSDEEGGGGGGGGEGVYAALCRGGLSVWTEEGVSVGLFWPRARSG